MKYVLSLALAAAAVLSAQDAERITVPLSDPSRPATLRVDLMNGDIEVKAHAANNVLVDMSGGSRRQTSRRPAEVDGLRRLDVFSTGLDIEERENNIRINTGPRSQNASIVVFVPQNTSLKLKTLGGRVAVEGVKGEVEATSLNGTVAVTNVEGSVVAHSLNGKVNVILNRVDPNKAMSFSTLNGDIDVTMPGDTKANIRLKNDHGEVWTDFEMKLQTAPKVESGRGDDGKYKVKFERTVTGTINGGGPDMSFTTMNGQIRLRKTK